MYAVEYPQLFDDCILVLVVCPQHYQIIAELLGVHISLIVYANEVFLSLLVFRSTNVFNTSGLQYFCYDILLEHTVNK